MVFQHWSIITLKAIVTLFPNPWNSVWGSSKRPVSSPMPTTVDVHWRPSVLFSKFQRRSQSQGSGLQEKPHKLPPASKAVSEFHAFLGMTELSRHARVFQILLVVLNYGYTGSVPLEFLSPHTWIKSWSSSSVLASVTSSQGLYTTAILPLSERKLTRINAEIFFF